MRMHRLYYLDKRYTSLVDGIFFDNADCRCSE